MLLDGKADGTNTIESVCNDRARIYVVDYKRQKHLWQLTIVKLHTV